MKISKIKIKNFRSIEEMEIENPTSLCAILGPNSSGITPEMYDKIHQEYQDTIIRLLHEKQKYSEGKSEYKLSIETIFSLAKRAKEIFESSEVGEQKMLLKFLLQNPVIDSKKPLYNLESPFDLVLEMSDSNKWLLLAELFRTKYKEEITNLGRFLQGHKSLKELLQKYIQSRNLFPIYISKLPL